VNGKKGVWGHAIGGMGSITQAMRKACEEQGVSIQLNSEVSEVLIDNGQVQGVRLSNGESISGNTIASNLNPSLLFDKLVDEAYLPNDFSRRIKH